jgi:hypothetical protein
MKLASIVFFALLLYAHVAFGVDKTLDLPLSALRAGELGPYGYSLLGAIALIGLVYVHSVKRLGEPDDEVDTRGFFLLLLIVAATPSNWPLHVASAIVMLASLYLYFATVFYRSGRSLFVLYLCIPLLLVIVTGFRSYGIWQKSMISSFVVAAALHQHMLKRGARAISDAAVIQPVSQAVKVQP